MATNVAGKAPGVYLEIEVRPPAPSLATGVPAFLGRLASPASSVSLFKAALDGSSRPQTTTATVMPLDYTAWSRLDAAMGTSWAAGYLGFAVRGFFQNGGQRCYIVTLPS